MWQPDDPGVDPDMEPKPDLRVEWIAGIVAVVILVGYVLLLGV